jgi:DNA (cytosine-5)-methyltransferase 1
MTSHTPPRALKLLDLFCGAGGAGMGYHRAGFEVIGVDVKPMPRYPFEFHQADALEYLQEHYQEFDVIHASPPCQAYSISRNNGSNPDAPKLIEPVRKALKATGKIYIIENVYGAPLENPVQVCGASFGLGVAGFDLNRHRYFESTIAILSMSCQHKRGKTIGVYGNGVNSWHRKKFGYNPSTAQMRIAMDIDWMVRKELSQAIPPAYTEWIGAQLIRLMNNE